MLPEILETKFKHSHYDIEIQHTLHPNHACELAKEAVQKRYKGVLAVGGDGTINEVATARKSNRHYPRRRHLAA